MSDDKLKETQEVPPITAADVLEVFGHFQDGLLERIDERDANVLKVMQNMVSELLAENRRITERGDEHERRIQKVERGVEELRLKYNELASDLTSLRLAQQRRTQGQ